MISLPLAMVAEVWTPDSLPTFLEAGVVVFEVLDVASQFFDHGDEALVVSGKLGVIRHQLLWYRFFIDHSGRKVI